MSHVPPPDSHLLRAAIGWMELGCHADALAELDSIQPALRSHPDVLEARWAILASAKDWSGAVDVAEILVRQYPERSSGWLHRAYAMRRTKDGGLELAMRALLPAVDQFPSEPVIPFNLACYACQMNRLDEARLWLDRAIKVGDRAQLKQMALSDDDLKPLWREIEKL